MELVTGFAGQAHVDPIDMAHVNAVAFGHDAYLLDTQNKLKPTLETANKLVVDTGDLMIQGHHFTVVQSEEIALQSGVSGQKRNALVCARYEKAEGTGVESASWIVKYGTATTGTPADPSVTTGNILDGVDSVHDEPIFRIEYDGITPGDPILLVPEFQSNAKFRDSIYQTIYQIVTKQIEPTDINSGRSLYVDTPEIEGYYPISATYARGATQPVCAPSGVVYTPGAAPYIRIINTSTTTERIEGTVYFLFIKKDLL